MIALETLRNSLPESEILSPGHPLALDRSWGIEYWAELLQPGVGRARANISMKNHVFPARRVLRKYGQCPTAPVLSARMVQGPRRFATAGGWWWNNLSGSFLGDLPAQPVVPIPLAEAQCCFVQSGLHGNHPDSVNSHFLCFQQTGFMGISGIPVKVKY